MENSDNEMPVLNDLNDLGRLYSAKTMFFRESVVELEIDGMIYEITTNVGDGSTIIRNNTTGQWFALSWPEIVALARVRGIDKFEEKQ